MLSTMSHPAQIVHAHEDRVNIALLKAEQARLVGEAEGTKGTEELLVRRLLRGLRDWHSSLFGPNHAQPTLTGRPGH